MSKKSGAKKSKIIQNRRAKFDYHLEDSLVVGIVLNGRETKALRLQRGQLQGAYVMIRDGQLWLINAQIHGTTGIPISADETTRDRKLLAKKREINKLIQAKQQGKSILPLEILTHSRYIKLRIAVGRGKKQYDKRQTIKQRDDQRNSRRALKNA